MKVNFGNYDLEALGMVEGELDLLATTRYGAFSVPIYVARNPDKRARDWDAVTEYRHAQPLVILNEAHVLKHDAKTVRRTLLHEFVHVVEWANAKEYLDPDQTEEQCTLLAQTMEEGLSQLWGNARLARVKS